MKVKKNDLFFLLYYMPLFFVKLLTFDAGSNVLKLVAVFCFGFFALRLVFEKKYTENELFIWAVTGTFLSLLVFTCSKEGALFSLFAIILMKNTQINRNMSILFYVGIVGVLVCAYLTRDTRVAVRYTGVSWVSMTKRSNIAYISFFAVVNLYLMTFKRWNAVSFSILTVLIYAAYKYTGCRTGLVCSFVLIAAIIAYQWKWVQESKVIKYLVISIPMICLVMSIVLVYLYERGNSVAEIINSLLQGRLRLGSLFMGIYSPKLFGQELAENFSSGKDFFVLDSAYLDMYLCYGVLFTVLWVALSCCVLNWLYEEKDYIGIAIVVSYSVFGMAETFLPNCFLNPSLLLYGKFILSKLGYEKDNSKPIRLFGSCRKTMARSERADL